jgi:type III pantothenate kinase
MKLLVDAGNSRVKWGLWDGGWVCQDSLPTADVARLDEVWSALPTPAQVFACSVAAATVRTSLDAWASARGVGVRWIESSAEQLGVRNGYRDPRQLGADRWVALIAAHQIVAGAALVVNAGTAVTVDALTGAGEFLGGLILPGPRLMAQALALGTAGLPIAAGEFQDFPSRTTDAIATGALHAICGAVSRMYRTLCSREGAAEIVLSGGAAQVIETHLDLPSRVVPNIVLEGLRVIASKERSP